eukprot:10550733-Heterocapsa_arctica.AAC.1
MQYNLKLQAEKERRREVLQKRRSRANRIDEIALAKRTRLIAICRLTAWSAGYPLTGRQPMFCTIVRTDTVRSD